jgi:hypothetical protein
MQTFLPYPSFAESAAVLDRNRLNNQRSEAKTILRIVTGELPNSRWSNHPAVRMWRDNPLTLALYAIAICEAWIALGYQESLIPWFELRREKLTEQLQRTNACIFPESPPVWLGDQKFHSSHRAALLFKNPTHYGQFGWIEEPKIEYVWPM